MVLRKLEAPRGILTSSAADRQHYRHERYHPSSDLDEYVEHYWVVEWDVPSPTRVETLPAPQRSHDLRTRRQERDSRPFAREVLSRPHRSGRGVRREVHAGRIPALRASPYVDVRGENCEPSARLRSASRRSGAGGSRREHERSRISVVESFLRAQRPPPDGNVRRVTEIVSTATNDRAILKVDDLVERFGLNKRTLRLFARYVGVSPKWVIQRYRLHEAAERLAAGEPAGHAALAVQLGYSDQAHFVRDFKAIVGVSPAAYARAARRTKAPSRA
jgi:AraC-like DNA-binding protein